MSPAIPPQQARFLGTPNIAGLMLLAGAEEAYI